MIARLALVSLFLTTQAWASPDPPDLVTRALAGGAHAYAVRLADEVGARLAGSPSAERAVAWAVQEMKAMSLENVRTEPVTVEAWSRGADDRVELVAPFKRRLRALALGRSPGTGPGGVTAEVVEVGSFEALRKLDVRGKIVFFNQTMQRTRTGEQYGTVGELRFRGAIEAGRAGAIAALVRSVGTGHHRLPHTGATGYEPGVKAIPFAALAAEDAELLHRALERGKAQVSLTLGCGMRGPVASANVVGEIRGRKWPEEIVLLGAHLDSWDVGDGALDDGAGVGMVLEAARLLRALEPARTVRIVLFMNEEYGLSGAKAYATAHAAELARHVAAMEADAGGGAPTGFALPGGDEARQLIAKLARPLATLGAVEVNAADEAGADLSPVRKAGVPVLGLRQDMSDYFEWHHTDGDTADKIDREAISRATAAFAYMAGQLAQVTEKLPRLSARP